MENDVLLEELLETVAYWVSDSTNTEPEYDEGILSTEVLRRMDSIYE